MFRNRLIVLSYHRVIPVPDPLFPEQTTANDFDMHLRVLAKYFRVFTLSEALSLLDAKALPARSVAITFDDGYADNATEALPILNRYGLKATFFVATKFIAGELMWNDKIIEAIRNCEAKSLRLENLGLGSFTINDAVSRRSAIDALLLKLKHVAEPERSTKVHHVVTATGSTLPDRLMMSEDQLNLLVQAGMEIGAHTVSHPILAKQSDKDAQFEISESGNVLRQLLGISVRSFAYPNGRPGVDYNERHATFARSAGFDAAVSTQVGAVNFSTDRYQLPRHGVWDRQYWKFVLRLLYWQAKG